MLRFKILQQRSLIHARQPLRGNLLCGFCLGRIGLEFRYELLFIDTDIRYMTCTHFGQEIAIGNLLRWRGLEEHCKKKEIPIAAKRLAKTIELF